MKQKKQLDEPSMTRIQKQAIVVCILCALAVLITASVTSVLVMRKVNETPEVPVTQVDPASPGLADYYQIDPTATAILGETEDAGEAYLAETLFLGDSNTVRCYNSGLLTLQQYCAKEGMTLQNALNEAFVPFKKDSQLYTMAQAVAMLKPRRVVITLGTNDTGLAVADFISAYSALITQIQQSYPYADIIVNTVPPIPENHATYPGMSQEKIDDFNMALVELCEQMEVKFLNSAEVLKDETGYGKSDYYVEGDIHLKSSGLKAMLNYVCTHAYDTEDRRPDTSNIPTRVQEYTNTPSAAVTPPPTPTPTSTPSVQYQAYYQVDRGVGGTLTCGDDKGKTSLSYDITDASKSLTVTAVPASGYLFVKWSDGVTTMSRTDTNFKQNVNVTALFASASVSISGGSTAELGKPYTIKASLSGKYSTAERLHWYVNGTEVPEVAGKTTVTITVEQSQENQTYEIQAAVIYNESKVTSNTIKITVDAAPQPPASSSASGSEPASSSASTPSDEEGASSASGSSSSQQTAASSKDSASGTGEQEGASSKAESEAGSGSGSTGSSSNSTGSSSDSTGSGSDSTGSSSSSSEPETAGSSNAASASQASGSSSLPEEPESRSSIDAAAASSAASPQESAASSDSDG